jgi:hypothetical protein
MAHSGLQGTKPGMDAPASAWCWWILAQETRLQRRAALAECPNDIRTEVEQMVMTMHKRIKG